MGSSRKYPCPSLPVTEGNGNSEGRGSKRRQFLSGWAVSYRGLFLGGLSKIGKLLVNNLSVKQAISYFTVTGVFTFK